MSIRVVVADDHLVVRQGIACMLADTDVELVGEAADGAEAVEVVLREKPDVAVIDVRMAQMDGLDALEKIREQCPDQAVVMLSTFDNPTYVARSAALGASDYILKGDDRSKLIEAIHHAAKGDSPGPSSLLYQVRGDMAHRKERVEDMTLTSRELQVLRHLALGLSNREIGRSLGISIETVKEHVQNVLRKVGASDRTQAAVWAVRKGMI